MQFSLKIHKTPARKNWAECLQRPSLERLEVGQAVDQVIAAVRTQGDQALRELTLRFSQAQIEDLEVSTEARKAASQSLPENVRHAIDLAKASIEKFHASQQEQAQVIETLPGVKCWRRSTPIEKVGLYIPTGSAPAVAAVLMLGLPARIAGCQEIILCTSPQADGSVHPSILYAADLAGVTRIFKVGGAQAIAAMAYGTESIPAVSKIFGSGNAYVVSAKHKVSREGIAIDMPTGQPEVMVVADETAKAELIAADLLAQASQSQHAHVSLLSLDKDLPKQVQKAIETALDNLPEAETQKALESLKNAAFLTLKTREDALEAANAYAPEQLVLHLKNANEFAQQVKNAGTVCLGPFSSPSAGEYLTGTNHSLPAQGFAKAYGSLTIEDYAKKITFQQVTAAGFEQINKAAQILAQIEEQPARLQALQARESLLDVAKK